MSTPHASSQLPLEADWIERPLVPVVEGHRVTGTARANWGAVQVRIASPISGVSRSRDGRGWAFAMLAHHRPEQRYALGGEFTARGIEAAGRMLTDLFLDWLAVSRHEAAVDEMCRRTRQELADMERRFACGRQPLCEMRSLLRRHFKAGEFTQQEYQQKLRGIRQGLDKVAQERWGAEETAREQFASSVRTCCGRRVSLDEAEKLLTEVAIVVEGQPGALWTRSPR